MSNYMMNSLFNDTLNVAVLSLKPWDDTYAGSDAAVKAGVRFLQSASLLKREQFLGLQIKRDEEGKSQVCAFSSMDAEVTTEDFMWMFQGCADIGSFSSSAPLIRNGNLNKIYELHRTPGNTWEQHESYGNKPSKYGSSISRDYFWQLLDEMKKNDAAIQIRAGVTNDGMAAGAFTLILPVEMPLRMRTMLSLTFPNTKVSRPSGSVENHTNNAIPMKCLLESMSGILEMLMKERREEKTVEEECGGFEDGSFNPFDLEPKCGPENSTAADGFTPIDELDLSIRPYNCLKRAGINSVEKLRRLSDEDYHHIRNLGRRSMEEIKQKLSEFGTLTAAPLLPAHGYTDMLNELIGLKEVKDQVRKITAFVKMRQDMKKRGMPETPAAFNMEFVGNPGTAKTTVARILAGIFYEIGLLNSNEIVEVGRADLVAKYVGQTADKVKSVFQRAKGKLLFIDEAYSLVENGEGKYGDEAINTIVQEMENNRNDTIVIFAGYPDKMKEFFSRNPGLRSRVPFRIVFSDYSAEEMVQIIELEAGKRGFSFGAAARELASSICKKALRYPDAGNGRFCRNLVENAILRYALRVYGTDDEGSADNDFLLQEEDFVFPENMAEIKGSVPIGFRVS